MSTQYSRDTRRPPLADSAREPQLRDLLKQLASDGGELVRNEMSLAKLEMRDMARELAADSAKLGMAVALAMTGALALAAAGIIALGNALDGRYALAALIIGAILLAIGAVLARTGMTGLSNGRGTPRTKQSLRRDRAFVRRELQELRQNIRS
ncbi:MAG TPA: phage holin family protein [Longimicrobiales bacterium]|nr:phage holin family protein [Longimicrobiales bacterium]